MVDLSQRTSGNKRQRSVHLDDATSDRLDRAAALSNSTRSQVLDRLIWEDLHLPEDDTFGGVIEMVRTADGAPERTDPGTPRPVKDDDSEYDPGPKPENEEFEL